ncbi:MULTISPECIES: hypothetical protein [Chryseobacterium]|uniref:Uncharacterized protein n=1 Tax=Chryseobacterium taihuense TaxID=1141221 RepID=A0A4U8WE27_9FLAO|nr:MULTISPECIES: hypothetical protein [Chryseobacterium]QQV02097.1 hypothetical protein I6I61_13580 [Chryseobacterium sp. FDAARGOS 1104]VFB04671.1 Uncharacterised protein [Chryseobacterium taihuense]
MKKHLIIYTLLFSCFLWSQGIIYPTYIYKKDLGNIILKRTDDIHFDYKQIQYIGSLQKNIELEYVDAYRYNKILDKNYRSENFESLNKEFSERKYKNLHIFVDTSQKTPLSKTDIDTTKMTASEYDAKLDSLNEVLKISKDLPTLTTYYDGFPVTIYNAEKQERVIGFGNNVALELEALDGNHKWQKISNYRKYTCGNGIKYFVLKPQEIVTVFEPRLIGNFKTKFRYRLGNIISNEFDGSINDSYLKKQN